MAKIQKLNADFTDFKHLYSKKNKS